MRKFAEDFYKSQAWKNTRTDYAASVGGLCEDCLERGEITPGEIVHHMVELTPDNINNPEISLNWDNLRLVCRKCHAMHHRKNIKRYEIDELGRVTIL